MNTQKLIATAAGAVFLLGAAVTANAASLTLSGSFNVTASATNGPAAGVVSAGPTNLGNVNSSGDGTINKSLTVNGASQTYNFVQLDPAGSCNTSCLSQGKTWMFGSNITHNIDVSDIVATFTGLSLSNGVSLAPSTVNFIDGTFYADYNSNAYQSGLGNPGFGVCDATSGVTDSDCVVWGTAYGNSSDVASLDFAGSNSTDTYTLEVDLNYAEDWNITPTVTLTLTSTSIPQNRVPEPASMVLFASGLAGLPVLRRRLRRKSAPAA